jgi:hypothetical protein
MDALPSGAAAPVGVPVSYGNPVVLLGEHGREARNADAAGTGTGSPNRALHSFRNRSSHLSLITRRSRCAPRFGGCLDRPRRRGSRRNRP